MNITLDKITVKAGKKSIISSVSALIPSGRTTVIIGENGSGKSTLLKAASALVPLAEGKIFYDGTPLDSIKIKTLAQKRAVVLQNPPVPVGLRVKEVLHLGRYAFDTARYVDDAAIAKAVELCRCGCFMERRMETLSGGEMRKVYLALALAQEPEILFLDEAEANTDAAFHAELPALLQQLKSQKNLTVVMVTHNLDLALKCADRIIGMKSGKLALSMDSNAVYLQNALADFTDSKWEFFKKEDGTLRAVFRYS